MELLKQQRAPSGAGGTSCLRIARLLVSCQRVVLRRRDVRRIGPEQRRRQVGLAQQPFQGAVVAFLVGPAGGAGPVQLQVELVAPHRQLGAAGLQPGQVRAHAAVDLGRSGGLLLPQRQLLIHLCRGAAAVVAHARQPQGFRVAGGPLPLQPVALHRQRVAAGADRGGHQRQHFGAAASPPAEQPVRERIRGIPGQLVGAEPAHPGGRRHHRQPGAEAEAVGQPGERVLPLRKGGAAVGLAFLELAQQRGGADQHRIGFHPRAIERLPSPLPHPRPDRGEQSGAVLL